MTLERIERAVLGEIYSSSILVEALHHLCDRIGPRFAGTDAEAEAAEWLGTAFDEAGLAGVRAEPFPLTGWTRGAGARVGVREPVRRTFDVTTLPYSADPGSGGVSGELAVLPAGTPEEFEAAGNLEGRIVLTREGVLPHYPRTVHRAEKFGRAVAAGAAGFLFAHPDPGGLDATGCARFGRTAEIPAAGLCFENARFLERLASRSTVRLELFTPGTTGPATSRNVIAEIPGRGDEVVIAGGHLDSHDIGPGARDNAAGVCVLLAAARAIVSSGFRPERTLRFVAFGAEEIGLRGSQAHAAGLGDGARSVRLMINVDGPPQSGEAGYQFQRFREAAAFFAPLESAWGRPVPVLPGLHPHSDHFPFFRLGVPVANLASRGGAYRTGRGFGHTAADTPDKVDLTALASCTDLVARTLVRVGGPDGLHLPWRTPADVEAVLEEEGLVQSLAYEQ